MTDGLHQALVAQHTDVVGVDAVRAKLIRQLLGTHAVHLGQGAHGLVEFLIGDLHAHVLGQLLQGQVAAHPNLGVLGEVVHEVGQAILFLHEGLVLAPRHALTLQVVLDLIHHGVAAAIQQRLRNLDLHAFDQVVHELLAAGVVAFLLGAAFQLDLQVTAQPLHALEIEGLGEFVVQFLKLLGLHVQHLHGHGVGGVLVVTVLVRGHVDFHGVALVLAQQGLADVLLGDIQVNGVRAVLAVLLDGHLVARLDGTVGSLEGRVALLKVSQGTAQHLVGDLGADGADFRFLPVAQFHLGVRFAFHGELERLTAPEFLRVDGGVHQVQFQFTGTLGVMHLQQAVTHLTFHVACTHAALDDLAGGLAGAETGHAHVAREAGPHLIVSAVHFGGGHGHLVLDLVAFSAD